MAPNVRPRKKNKSIGVFFNQTMSGGKENKKKK